MNTITDYSEYFTEYSELFTDYSELFADYSGHHRRRRPCQIRPAAIRDLFGSILDLFVIIY